MKNVTQPSFLTFIVSAILMFIGIVLKANSVGTGNIILYLGFALMGVFWIWSIIKVVGAPDMRPFQKRFWMIAVIAVPVLGGLLFHIMHQRSGKIVS